MPRIPWLKKTATPAESAAATRRDGDQLDELLKKWQRSESTGGDPHTANRIGDAYLARNQRADAVEWFEKAMSAYLDKGMLAPAYSLGIKVESRLSNALPVTIHELMIVAAARRGFISDVEDRVRAYLAVVATALDDRTGARALRAILKAIDRHNARSLATDRAIMTLHAAVEGNTAAATRLFKRSAAYRTQGDETAADEMARLARKLDPNASPPPMDDEDVVADGLTDEAGWLFDLDGPDATDASDPTADADNGLSFMDFGAPTEAPAAPEPREPAPTPAEWHAFDVPTNGAPLEAVDLDPLMPMDPPPAAEDGLAEWAAVATPPVAPVDFMMEDLVQPVDDAPETTTESPVSAADRLAHSRHDHIRNLLDQASAHFNATIDPSDYEKWYDVGLTYSAMGLFDQALMELRKAADSPDPLRRLAVAEAMGECYVLSGQAETAADYLLACLPEERPLTEAHLHYLGIAYLSGVALVELGRHQEAGPLLQYVEQYAPGFKDVAAYLRLVHDHARR